MFQNNNYIFCLLCSVYKSWQSFYTKMILTRVVINCGVLRFYENHFHVGNINMGVTSVIYITIICLRSVKEVFQTKGQGNPLEESYNILIYIVIAVVCVYWLIKLNRKQTRLATQTPPKPGARFLWARRVNLVVKPGKSLVGDRWEKKTFIHCHYIPIFKTWQSAC